MRLPLLKAVLLGTMASISLGAHAEGCLKGAAVGGVGGHFVHQHGVLGAALGCAVGHHLAKKKEKQVIAQHASESAQNNTGASTSAQPTSKNPINP